MTTPLSTRALLERLQRHYIKPGAPVPGGIFLPEVGWNNGSGLGGCDALYVGFTATSGRILVGHELKVSRSDWLNELGKPGKADPWADQCHEWWLVVSDLAIVHDGELPAGWGLMSATGPTRTRLQIHQKPDRKPPTHQPSWLACRSIMARQDTLRARAITDARYQAEETARSAIDEQVEKELARRQGLGPEVERARSIVRELSERRIFVRDDREIVDAIAEVLQGRRLLESFQSLVANRLRAVEDATRELKSSWQHRDLVEQLNEAAKLGCAQ